MNEFARRLLPPIVREMGNRLIGKSTIYRGPYPDWAAACAVAPGYANAAKLARVASYIPNVRPGQSYEQDGRLLRGIPPPGYALSGILQARPMSVLDFGGSLGSTYRRWKPFLNGIAWHVVELPEYVEAGQRLLTDDPNLTFGTELRHADVVLVAGVLQYLSSPEAMLATLAKVADTLILDRTPMGPDAILTQHNPDGLSYPSRVLSEDRIADVLTAAGMRQVFAFDSNDKDVRCGKIHAMHRGAIWTRHHVHTPNPDGRA